MTRARQVRAIAALTLLEALRGRLLWLLALVLGAALGLAGLLGSLAITETRQVQAAVLGSFLRLAAVVVTSLFVISSMVREMNEKVVEIYFSLPLPRAVYYLGKLSGFAVGALMVAASCTVLAAFFSPPEQAAMWGLSLFAELLLIIAVSLLCLFTLNQVTGALSVVLGFYLLARAIGAMQLMTRGPFSDPNALADQVVRWLVDGLAFLLPDLYRFTASDWLVYGSGSWEALESVALQTVVYLALLAGAGLFDLYRKSL